MYGPSLAKFWFSPSTNLARTEGGQDGTQIQDTLGEPSNFCEKVFFPNPQHQKKLFEIAQIAKQTLSFSLSFVIIFLFVLYFKSEWCKGCEVCLKYEPDRWRRKGGLEDWEE